MQLACRRARRRAYRIPAAISRPTDADRRLRLRAEMVDDEGLRARIVRPRRHAGPGEGRPRLRAQPGRTQSGAGDRARPPAGPRRGCARHGLDRARARSAGGRIVGNPSALRRALWNLIENGEVRRQGRVALACVGALRIRVRDHGPGLAEDSSKVFEPFYRTEASRNRENRWDQARAGDHAQPAACPGRRGHAAQSPDGGLERSCGCACRSARQGRGRSRARRAPPLRSSRVPPPGSATAGATAAAAAASRKNARLRRASTSSMEGRSPRARAAPPRRRAHAGEAPRRARRESASPASPPAHSAIERQRGGRRCPPRQPAYHLGRIHRLLGHGAIGGPFAAQHADQALRETSTRCSRGEPAASRPSPPSSPSRAADRRRRCARPSRAGGRRSQRAAAASSLVHPRPRAAQAPPAYRRAGCRWCRSAHLSAPGVMNSTRPSGVRGNPARRRCRADSRRRPQMHAALARAQQRGRPDRHVGAACRPTPRWR